MLKLDDKVDKIPLIGPKYKSLLANLDIYTVKDLLVHFPSRYEDTSKISKISELTTSENKTVSVNVDDIKNIRTRGGTFLTQATVYDDSGSIEVIWFNQPFLKKTIKPSSKVLLNGKLNPKRNIPQLYSPKYDIIRNNKSTHLGHIIPIYSTCEGISTKWLRSRINYIVNKNPKVLQNFESNVPQHIESSYNLMVITEAFKHIHFPKSQKHLERAKKRLGFEELFTIQLNLVKKIRKQREKQGPDIQKHRESIDKFLDNLEFTPTEAQNRVIDEIVEDFTNSYPANRLLQGDVGSGKTLVAAASAIPAIKSGYQVAIMAPTAILARQHYETLTNLFEDNDINIKLITGNTSNKGYELEANSYELLIGTHALLHRQKEIFKKLGLVIIDEQHRFGVKQRKKLVSQSNSSKNRVFPHKITMTATPIPRSIALTLFGDLSISIIDQLPPGRLPTKTHLVPHKKRSEAYEWIREQITEENAQVFWICPLIEESDKLQTKAVITEYEKLENNIFPKLSIDMLHGKLSDEEKNNKISRMKDGKTDILVSTSVIEVGMDIPNANIIVIEGAERFGLAQLHQLRGRVGRKANSKSWCFLFTSKNASPEASKRLRYFSKVNDGLKVAKFDLANRGPGEVYGTKQAGIPDLKIAKLSDTELIAKTREAARKALETKVR